MKIKITLFLIISFSLTLFWGDATHNDVLVFLVRPFTIPLIALYFYLGVDNKWTPENRLRMLAFVFSWIGDLSLLLVPKTITDVVILGIPKNKYFFFAGLGSFLIAQLFFIATYKKAVTSIATNKINRFYYIPFVIYWIVMLGIVLPPIQLDAEKKLATIPVIVYASILLSMAAVAFSRYGKTNPISFWITFLGGCIFVVSDSLIAINFLALPEPTSFASISISVTYIAAEFMIAEGILWHSRSSI